MSEEEFLKEYKSLEKNFKQKQYIRNKKINTLNKGIDELIEKVEKEIIETTKQIDLSICPGALVPIGRKQAYETFLEDLKSLKGE